ncbi:band 7 protein AGAP004871-like [Watersipora subatra]|uniref:band 7 protein AGAP004871-like n=1 Tax=Watersipora subatra TaxID=2589382 RepID=UPI00355C81C6
MDGAGDVEMQTTTSLLKAKTTGCTEDTTHKISCTPLHHEFAHTVSTGYCHDDSSANKGMGHSCNVVLKILSWILIILTFPFSLFICIRVVLEYERAVIFRLGRLVPGGAVGPGLFFVYPCMDRYIKIDMRTVSFDVPTQEILTKDSVTIAVDAVVYYRVFNPVVAVTNVEDANSSTRLLAQSSLRNVLGTQSLSDILVKREEIAHCMQSCLDVATDPWGIKVERVEIKDVRIPTQLQRALAAEAEASREAKAKIIAAEGEQNAARALREASEVISSSPAALQLRYLQTLNAISTEKNSTIVFPLPIDIMSAWMNRQPPAVHSIPPTVHSIPPAVHSIPPTVASGHATPHSTATVASVHTTPASRYSVKAPAQGPDTQPSRASSHF